MVGMPENQAKPTDGMSDKQYNFFEPRFSLTKDFHKTDQSRLLEDQIFL